MSAPAPDNRGTFPPPPAFYKLYRSEETALPPPAPITGPYSVFAVSQDDAARSLEEQGIECLYSKEVGAEGVTSGATYKSELLRLNRDLLSSFVAVLETSAPEPVRAGAGDAGTTAAINAADAERHEHEQKLMRLKLLMINIHDLLNSFRSHQARETLVETMRAQLQEKQATSKAIHECLSSSREQLQGSFKQLAQLASSGASQTNGEGVP